MLIEGADRIVASVISHDIKYLEKHIVCRKDLREKHTVGKKTFKENKKLLKALRVVLEYYDV